MGEGRRFGNLNALLLSVDKEDNAGMKKRGPGGDLNAVPPVIERAWIDRTDKWDRTSGGHLNALLLAVDCGNMMQLDGHQGGDQKAELSAVDRGEIFRRGEGGRAGRTFEASPQQLYR